MSGSFQMGFMKEVQLQHYKSRQDLEGGNLGRGIIFENSQKGALEGMNTVYVERKE